MKIERNEDWNKAMSDTTKVYFVVLGAGTKQQQVYTEAENQALREPARGALWVEDSNLACFPLMNGGDSAVISCTLCFQRHVVARFKSKDLSPGSLPSTIDDAFGEAALHD